jgi:hypothetical protein
MTTEERASIQKISIQKKRKRTTTPPPNCTAPSQTLQSQPLSNHAYRGPDIISLRSSERTATRRSKELLELEYAGSEKTPLAAIAERQHTREEEQQTNDDDLVICCHTTWIRKEQQINIPTPLILVPRFYTARACGELRRVINQRENQKRALLASCVMEVLFVIFIRRFLCSSRRPAAGLKKMKRT